MPRNAHIFHQKVAGSVSKEELPASARLLAVDMNLAPPVALRYVARGRAMLPDLKAACSRSTSTTSA